MANREDSNTNSQNRTYLVESQLFPCVDYFKTAIQYKNIKIELYDNFQKMSFRNRYMIAGANGLCGLTVPVAGGREQKTLMREVQIELSGSWQIKHWRSITSAYKKAPYFEFYSAEVKNLLFSNENSLFEFNLSIIRWLVKVLNMGVAIEFTERFDEPNGSDQDFRNHFLPKNYHFDREGWLPKYSQVFEDRLGFQPNLSIIDLLFCEGPNSVNLLSNSVK
jgi:hypothetical protein